MTYAKPGFHQAPQLWRLFSVCAVVLGCGLLLIVFGFTRATAAESSRAKTSKKTQRAVLPPAPAGVTIEPEVAYLESGRQERLDLYYPSKRPGSEKTPGIVIIHGGGWTGGDKAAAREFNIGTTLAEAGYFCASIEYWKQGPNRWPTNLFDCKNAVRYLRKNAGKFQLDPEHIGVIGGSAGGHLALMVAYTADVPELSPPAPYPGISDGVQACVDMYGISDLLTRKNIAADGTPGEATRQSAALFPEAAAQEPSKWKLASPVNHIDSKSPPTLILHGTSDTTVDYDQSKELDRKLAEKGVEHQLILLPEIGHTFDLQEWRRKPLPQDLRPVVTAFFDKHLRPGQAGSKQARN